LPVCKTVTGSSFVSQVPGEPGVAADAKEPRETARAPEHERKMNDTRTSAHANGGPTRWVVRDGIEPPTLRFSVGPCRVRSDAQKCVAAGYERLPPHAGRAWMQADGPAQHEVAHNLAHKDLARRSSPRSWSRLADDGGSGASVAVIQLMAGPRASGPPSSRGRFRRLTRDPTAHSVGSSGRRVVGSSGRRRTGA